VIKKNKIRFAFWGAEELGLLGSRFYVDDLKENDPAELSRLALNLNFDMVGSPNFFFGIYNGSGAAPNIRERSVLIQRQFETALITQGKPFDLTPFNGRSDYGPFIENGVAAGGLFSGAEEIKNAAGRARYGGLANTPYDPCYHFYCDSYDNISEESIEILSIAAYRVTYSLATALFSPIKYTIPTVPYRMEMHPDAIAHY